MIPLTHLGLAVLSGGRHAYRVDNAFIQEDFWPYVTDGHAFIQDYLWPVPAGSTWIWPNHCC